MTLPLKQLTDERKTFYNDAEKEEAWTETAAAVKKYGDEMVKRWKEEIDTHLVFVRTP